MGHEFLNLGSLETVSESQIVLASEYLFSGLTCTGLWDMHFFQGSIIYLLLLNILKIIYFMCMCACSRRSKEALDPPGT